MLKRSFLMIILVKRGSRLSGEGLHACQNEISYIESHAVTASRTEEKAPIESEEDACIKGNHVDSSTEAATEKVSKRHGVISDKLFNEENKNLKKFVSYLQRHLSKYEDVISYNDFVEKLNKGDIDIDIDNKTGDEKGEEVSNEHAFAGPEDEEFQEVVKTIGEGATSEVFKVVDNRTGEVVCKKVIKETDDDNSFKTLQNTMKEICTLQSVRHPCICETFGYNMQEPLEGQTSGDDYFWKSIFHLICLLHMLLINVIQSKQIQILLIFQF